MRIIGVALVAIGGIAAIGVGFAIAGTTITLWAIVFLVWSIARASARGENPDGRPVLFGAVILVGYLLIIAIMVHRGHSAWWLWLMVIVNILADLLVRKRKPKHPHAQHAAHHP